MLFPKILCEKGPEDVVIESIEGLVKEYEMFFSLLVRYAWCTEL